MTVVRVINDFDRTFTVVRTVGHFDQNLIVARTGGQNDQLQIPTKIMIKNIVSQDNGNIPYCF